MYCLYQVIVVLKYNLRQLNINSCLLPYKNIYKNRVFKEVDIHTKELINQNSLFFVCSNEPEVFVRLVISDVY